MKVKFTNYHWTRTDDGLLKCEQTGSGLFVQISSEIASSRMDAVELGGKRFLVLHQGLMTDPVCYADFVVGVEDTWKGRWIRRYSKAMQAVIAVIVAAECWVLLRLGYGDGDRLPFSWAHQMLWGLGFFTRREPNNSLASEAEIV